MILFFVDDSGNTGARLDHPVETIHWLVALAVDESLVRSLDREFHHVASLHFGPELASAAEFEVKGSDLFGGRRFASKLSPQERLDCYGQLLALLAPHHAKVFVRGISKPRHAQRAIQRGYKPEHPYFLGFQYLVEAIDTWLASLPGEQLGLMVADQQQEIDRRMVHQFNQWAHLGTPSGYRARILTRLLPALHYVRSADSRLVQLVDLVAFLRNRRTKCAIPAVDASDLAVQSLWNSHCGPLVVSDRVWP